MHLGTQHLAHFLPRYLPEINAAAAEAEKLNETVGGSMGLESNNCHSKFVRAPRI